MIWKYGIFCAILSGSVWGTFWQVILTILAILTTGMQLSLEIAPALFSGALIGFIYLIYQKYSVKTTCNICFYYYFINIWGNFGGSIFW